mmetsp:Transcript_78603/g.138563  ORF Transcript_78603/g.138563 Transcript_78603/m.138563 type:complete len:136 (+) Transcript_78603:56-463(+)|eukprot:CAMPEP_0197652406 /NCGR_PEP_ID=MMETSP1338-20131121/34433_1 /TAXON_ID=43686 ORGANISM="Pelagodinium beii, Strain RCC1491" /NCGR_SAMPLE_ID=MMETSP1338 /ASSEMBLY_ACC=CAM_ASM_000754 /LENGTH=135 /DNA_ID=CAMNT_0043227279 /DNA_START=50 /DNA_END=457 /DNA_ORIENTATION=+
MAPVNRAAMKTRHLNWAIACNKERAYHIGDLPPLSDPPPIDIVKMARSEYFPIGGRNAVNNNSSFCRSTLGPSSYAGSGGLRSAYQNTIGTPIGPKGLSFTASSFSASPAQPLKGELPGVLKSYSRTMSAPALTR